MNLGPSTFAADALPLSSGGVESASSFKIICFNANSIGKNPKRKKVFHHLKKKNFDCVIACDTRISAAIEKEVENEWGGKCIFNSFSSQTRGVAIFFKSDCRAKLLDDFRDIEGNVLAVLLGINEEKILLVQT